MYRIIIIMYVLTQQISKTDDWRERRKHLPKIIGLVWQDEETAASDVFDKLRSNQSVKKKERKPRVITHRVVWSTRRLAMKRQRLQQLGSIGVVRLLNPEMVAVAAIGVAVELGRVRTVRRGVDDVVGSREMIATAVPETDADAFGRFT
jgi:hypothetical protein